MRTTVAAALACLMPALSSVAAAQTTDAPDHLETQAVERVLRHYREAVEALDAKRVKDIWPSVNEKALTKAFALMEQQSLSFDGCVIGLDGGRASATCTGSARIVPRVGNPAPHYLVGEWRFALQKTAQAWIILSVEARSG